MSVSTIRRDLEFHRTGKYIIFFATHEIYVVSSVSQRPVNLGVLRIVRSAVQNHSERPGKIPAFFALLLIA